MRVFAEGAGRNVVAGNCCMLSHGHGAPLSGGVGMTPPADATSFRSTAIGNGCLCRRARKFPCGRYKEARVSVESMDRNLATGLGSFGDVGLPPSWSLRGA